jgi:hypothetical protein
MSGQVPQLERLANSARRVCCPRQRSESRVFPMFLVIYSIQPSIHPSTRSGKGANHRGRINPVSLALGVGHGGASAHDETHIGDGYKGLATVFSMWPRGKR